MPISCLDYGSWHYYSCSYCSSSSDLHIRFLYILRCSGKPLHGKSRRTYSALIVLGSGGHTAEMLNLLSVLQKDGFAPGFYIAAATDNISLQKARVMEDSLIDAAGVEVEEAAKYWQIYWSREVGQSYVTYVWTILVAAVHAIPHDSTQTSSDPL